MADMKVIAVVGATGAQGGGLARAILDAPSDGFACRALTRNPSSGAARALADRGAELVQADLDDQDSLIRAFSGAHAAYCMTNFFEHFSPDRELEQAASLARAAKAAGIGHVIWSSSMDSRGWLPPDDDRMPSAGRYKVPYWDAKAEADHFFIASGVPTTFVLPSMFWENFLTQGAPQVPQRGEDGVLAITLPAGQAKLPGIAAEDIGRCAYGVFQAGDTTVGTHLGLAAEHLTAAQLAAGLSTLLGEEVRYNDIPLDSLRAAPAPGVDAVANMFQIITESNEQYCALYDPDVAAALNPRLQSFPHWLAANSSRLRAPVGAGER